MLNDLLCLDWRSDFGVLSRATLTANAAWMMKGYGIIGYGIARVIGRPIAIMVGFVGGISRYVAGSVLERLKGSQVHNSDAFLQDSDHRK